MAKAELCVVKKPVLFVPFPFAAEDHQTVNAMNLVEKHAALMVKDSEAMEKLVPTVLELVKDEARQVSMQEALSKLAISNADEIVATEILKIVDLDGSIA